MNRASVSFVLRGAGVLLMLAIGLVGNLPAASPNIVVMIADDLGWGDVSYNGGVARTPHLDQLRREGLELNRFYANPTCSPTRAAFLTGRAALRLGIREPVAPNGNGLALSEHLISETFRAGGYQTALVGKWHLGSTSAERRPNARGFDHFYGFLGGGVSYTTHEANGRTDWQRNGATVNEVGYSTDLLVDEEIRLLRTRDPARPFFHVLAFNAPHLPLEAPEGLRQNYPSLSADEATYAAMIESMDLGLGRVLAELSAQNLDQSTLVVFFSDNGGANMTPASNRPLRLAKGNVYDGGIRTPAIMRWPGVLGAGQKTEQFIAAMDLFPTLAAAVGVTPRNPLAFDGTNLWSELRSGGIRGNREITIVSATNTAHFDGPWKLVRLAQRDELYQIELDAGETNDLRTSQPEVMMRLQTSLGAAIARLTGPETPTPPILPPPMPPSTATPARLVNLATRAQVGGAAGTPIAGFAIGGGGSKRVLIRAIGPALADFGVGATLADPNLAVVSGGVTIASNDHWNAADGPVFTEAGAFALASGSRDAAVVLSLSPGAYTTPVGDGGGSGLVLLEMYDADAAGTATSLVNASARAFVGTGESVLIPGFVIVGEGTVKLLVRAVGPTLADFGVGDVLVDPQLTLFQGSTAIAVNDNWSESANAAEVAAAAGQSGAFMLATGSRDAALLVTLSAGAFTASISGVGGGTGTALMEIYVVK